MIKKMRERGLTWVHKRSLRHLEMGWNIVGFLLIHRRDRKLLMTSPKFRDLSESMKVSFTSKFPIITIKDPTIAFRPETLLETNKKFK